MTVDKSLRQKWYTPIVEACIICHGVACPQKELVFNLHNSIRETIYKKAFDEPNEETPSGSEV